MQLVIEIPEEEYEYLKTHHSHEVFYGDAIANGIPLPEYLEGLKRRLLMEVDGGTDDKYLRYADVCDRISNTFDTYIKAESEDKE